LPSFQVTTPNARVNLRPEGTLDVPYSVTNVSAGARRAAFSVKASDPQTQKWYSIRGTPSLEFSPGTTQQVIVVVAPANGAAPKDYSFSLIAALADNPDIDFTEGPSVTYALAAADKKKFPWWLVIAAVAIVAIIAAIIFFVTHTRVPALPPRGSSVNDTITAAGLKPIPPGPQTSPCSFLFVWGVARLDPAPGTWVARGSEVREVGGCVSNPFIFQPRVREPVNLHT